MGLVMGDCPGCYAPLREYPTDRNCQCLVCDECDWGFTCAVCRLRKNRALEDARSNRQDYINTF